MKRLLLFKNELSFVRCLRQRAPLPLSRKTEKQVEAPPTTMKSLKSIREQISLATDSSRNSSSNTSALTPNPMKSLRSPNDFYDAPRFIEGMKIRKKILQEKLFNDSDEVLRKKNKEDTMKYMNLAFHGVHSLPPLNHVRRVLDKVEKKYDSLVELLEENVGDDSALWVEAFYTLSDDELHMLWSCGFLDLTILEEMLLPVSDSVPEHATLSETSLSERSSVSLENYLTENHSSLENLRSLGDRIAYFKKLRSYSELTQSIHETALIDAPTVDLAPTVDKALKKQFDNISEEELLNLQKYEDDKSISLFAVDRKNEPRLASVTESMLNRAVLPSNAFLDAVSKYDHPLRKSMEILERTKRHTLLDTTFQEAIQNARDMEEGTDPYRTENFAHINRKRKLPGGYKGSRDPFSRTDFATDIPLFYGARQSVVPPQGRYGLPSPRISKETRRMLRKRKKASFARFRR